MDTNDLQGLLMDLFDDMARGDGADGGSYTEFNDSYCRTFDDAQLLTRDDGIVINFADGSEFNLIIQQTSRSKNGN